MPVVPDPKYATDPLPPLAHPDQMSGEVAGTDGQVWEKPCDAFSKHKKCQGRHFPDPKNVPDPTKITALLETLRKVRLVV